MEAQWRKKTRGPATRIGPPCSLVPVMPVSHKYNAHHARAALFVVACCRPLCCFVAERSTRTAARHCLCQPCSSAALHTICGSAVVAEDLCVSLRVPWCLPIGKWIASFCCMSYCLSYFWSAFCAYLMRHLNSMFPAVFLSSPGDHGLGKSIATLARKLEPEIKTRSRGTMEQCHSYICPVDPSKGPICLSRVLCS